VPVDGGQQRLLVLGGQPGQGRRQARAHLPSGQTSAAGRRQVAPDGHPALHPRRSPSQQPPDGRPGQLVVVQQRADDTGLVRRGQGAPRRVALQQQRLVLDGLALLLDDDGDERVALFPPAAQPLEAIEHFEAAVLGGRRDPER
jgi:hypothetical protein